MPKPTNLQPAKMAASESSDVLDRITDLCVEDIMEMTDDEILNEFSQRGDLMTKKELLKALDHVADDDVVVVADENGCWDNIIEVGAVGSTPAIIFGGGSPFSSDH